MRGPIMDEYRPFVRVVRIERKPATLRAWLSGVAVLAIVTTAVGVGLRSMQPTGRTVGMVQFDAISELNLEWSGDTNIVVFSRYWVCPDCYAVSTVWTEPLGGGRDVKSSIILSDETGFRMENEHHSFWGPTNTVYPKPVGERPPFRWGGGLYGREEMRFAEAEALAKRVFVDDLVSVRDLDGTADIKVADRDDGIRRNVARLKVQASHGCIESIELFDRQERSLARVTYAYERSDGSSSLARLTAELPVRPETLGVDGTITISSEKETRTHGIPDVNYVSHEGGRTCTVMYEEVMLDQQVFRLPRRIRVERSDNKQPMRFARLMNFKRVDLDKDGIWKAAKAFGGLGPEYVEWERLRDRFSRRPEAGPLPMDPNDLASVRALIAKYPVWERPSGPSLPKSTAKTRTEQDSIKDEADAREQILAHKRERAELMKRSKAWQREVAQMPKPPRKVIEPNDVRVIRQLCAHYDKRWSQLRKNQEGAVYVVPESERQRREVHRALREVLRYHHASALPEDRPAEPNDVDLNVIRGLKGRCEQLAARQEYGLGGRLKALCVLTHLDRMVKDYDALEGHVARYLQTLEEAQLHQMYMAGGSRHIARFAEAGHYDKANEVLRLWSAKSAATNDADGVYRFCGSDLGGKRYPWIALGLLDCFLKRGGLTPLERYEGLALRAIALDDIDRMLTAPEEANNGDDGTQVEWIRQSTTPAKIAGQVVQAVREAVSAWEALGEVRLSTARPYSTVNRSASQMNIGGLPFATRLQETSARLDEIVHRRISERQKVSPGRRGR